MDARTTARAMILLAALAAMSPERAGAQALVTPDAHWGAIMIPDLDYRVDLGVHFMLFTQFGKETLPGTTQYTFEPYNDIDRTIGFNVLSLARTSAKAYFPTTESSLQIRNSFAIGVINDHITEYLQNRLAHNARIRRQKLARVPRYTTSDPKHPGYGPASGTPIFQFSQEFFFRPDEHRRLAAQELTRKSHLFLGGGYTVGSIDHEIFLHAGTNPIGRDFERGAACLVPTFLCVDRIGVGGMVRGGLALESKHLNDLATTYVNVQGMGELAFEVRGFPAMVQTAITGTSGFFAEPMDAADSVVLRERQQAGREVYHRKRGKLERFGTHRLRVGGWTFEYMNDEPGGKDKGPSFGVSTSVEISRTAGKACEVGNYFDVDPGAKGAVGNPEPAGGRNWLVRQWHKLRCTL